MFWRTNIRPVKNGLNSLPLGQTGSPDLLITVLVYDTPAPPPPSLSTVLAEDDEDNSVESALSGIINRAVHEDRDHNTQYRAGHSSAQRGAVPRVDI